MLRNIALTLLGVLFVSELKNSYRDDKVKVYLLLTQTGEENTTVLPIVMSSNIPENISLKDLLSSVPDNCKISLPHTGIAPDTGVSANVHNYSRKMEEPFENTSYINRTYLHQFTNKSKQLNDSIVKKNRSNNRSIILKKLHSKTQAKDNKIVVNITKLELNNHNATIDNQSTINQSLSQTIYLENDTKDALEGNHISSNVSQGVPVKLRRLHSKIFTKSSKITNHSSQHKLSNNNENVNNESSIKKHLSDASISRNFSREELYENHDVKDVYYVVHTCSQKRCRIHQVVVLKKGTVQEEDMEAILETINQSQYSSHNTNDWLNEWQVSFSDVINGMLHSHLRNIQWLLPAILSLSLALLTKLICDIYTYKKKVDITYLFMEESISDIKELADILKNYTTAQLILERRILLACNKETDNETQIRNMKNEIAHLKITVRSLDGSNIVNMDDFVTSVLNYLQNCLESGTDSTTDEVQQWNANEVSDTNNGDQLT